MDNNLNKKPNQEKAIETSEKNILFRFPIFNKTKPYLWLKAVLPEDKEYQDIYRIAFNATFFKSLDINIRVFREDLHLLEPHFKIDIDKTANKPFIDFIFTLIIFRLSNYIN